VLEGDAQASRGAGEPAACRTRRPSGLEARARSGCTSSARRDRRRHTRLAHLQTRSSAGRSRTAGRDHTRRGQNGTDTGPPGRRRTSATRQAVRRARLSQSDRSGPPSPDRRPAHRRRGRRRAGPSPAWSLDDPSATALSGVLPRIRSVVRASGAASTGNDHDDDRPGLQYVPRDASATPRVRQHSEIRAADSRERSRPPPSTAAELRVREASGRQFVFHSSMAKGRDCAVGIGLDVVLVPGPHTPCVDVDAEQQPAPGRVPSCSPRPGRPESFRE
jgi:hypothetical protein